MSGIPELSSTAYAQRRKELLLLIKQLRAMGAQADLDLPRITVIGGQSAGKSSLIEAISGITVPRDPGTCTRCPMECRLSSSTRLWSCRVSIRWEFEDDSQRRKGEVLEINFGPTIYDKADVELRLRQAQAAVLNPNVPAQQFLGLSAEELKSGVKGDEKPLRFSKNVVCIDLEGPELTDLSFIDLPGLIENADDDVVKLIEDLAVSYIQGNCLILVAVPVTYDMEHIKALKLASKEDPTGKRTIGVLTKLDLLAAGSSADREFWLDVLEGRHQRLAHGYFGTRQPDDDERATGIIPSEARVREAAFFDTTAPWKDSTSRERLGTLNLVGVLSRLLVTVINETLPKLVDQTTTLLNACNDELSNIPPAPSGEPATQMLTLITGLCSVVRQYANGGPNSAQLVQKNREAWKQLKFSIRATAPNFQPYVDAKSSGPLPSEEGEGEDAEEQYFQIPAQGVIYLPDMRRHLDKSITRELPDNIPFHAKIALIESFQRTWHTSAEVCFGRVRENTVNILRGCISNRFQRYEALQHLLRNFVDEFIQEHHIQCSRALDVQLKMEKTPFTQNSHYLESSKEKWLSIYKGARAKKMAPPGATGTASRPQPPPSRSPIRTGSSKTPYKAFLENDPADPSTVLHYQNISMMPAYRGSSGEKPVDEKLNTTSSQEIRVQDYAEGHRTDGSISQSSTFGGTQAQQQPSGKAGQTTPMRKGGSSTQVSSPFTFRASGASSPAPAFSTAPEEKKAGSSQPNLNNPSFVSPTTQPTVQNDPETVRLALSALASLGYTGLTEEDLPKLLQTDEYETELRVMAEVRGYFQVSYKRVIDNVPSVIDLLFVKAIAEGLQDFLIAKLELGTASASARCAKYLAEDPGLVAKREDLLAKKKRLEAATAGTL